MKPFIYLIVFLFAAFMQATAQDSPASLFNKAMEAKRERNCAEVLQLLDRALELKPDFGDAYLEKGWCLNELSRSAEALPVLKKAAFLLQNNSNVSYELGHAYYYQENTDSAFKYFSETLKLKPDHFLASMAMGDLFREKKEDSKQALIYYLKAFKTDSSHKKTNYWAGWCYNDNGKYDSAVYHLRKVQASEPENPLVSVELGYAYYSLSRFRESIDAFKTALAVKPKPEIAIFYTGMCLTKTGSKSEALDKYNELVILNSSYAVNLLSAIQKMK